MNLFPSESLEYQIIEKLQKKSWVIVDLIKELQVEPNLPTKQAFYLAIRKLKKSEIVVVAKKRIALSSIWIEKIHAFFSVAKYSYAGKVSDCGQAQIESFLGLEEGDRISYEFGHPETADIFWGHAFTLLMSSMPKNEPVYLYNPHEWFLLARQETELIIAHQSEREGHPWILYIAGTTALDKYTRSLLGKPSLVYANNEQLFKRNYYTNIFGDFLIEATLDQKTQDTIDAFYKTHSKFDETAEKQIRDIISNMHGRTKIVISRNKKKAERIKRIFKKYF